MPPILQVEGNEKQVKEGTRIKIKLLNHNQIKKFKQIIN